MRYKVGDVVLCCERSILPPALKVDMLYDIVEVDECFGDYLLSRSGSKGFLHFLPGFMVHRCFKFVGDVFSKEEDML